MKYSNLAQRIVTLVGGKENIESVVHCMTRLRFSLKDHSIANKEELKELDGVIQVIFQSGQFQVVIGNEVENVYNEILPLVGSTQSQVNEEKNVTNESLVNRMIKTISGVFFPILGILTACGVLKGLLSILLVSGILKDTQGTYIFLSSIADMVFYFFPVVVGVSAAKYFKMNLFIGLGIGAILIYPTFVSLAAEGSSFSFVGLPMTMTNYTSTVFPSILAVYVASRLEKILKRVVPPIFQLYGIPLTIFLIIIPLTFWIIGPITNALGSGISYVITAGYTISPILAGIIICGPGILMTTFGLHWVLITVLINEVMTTGSSSILGLSAVCQLAMAGALFGLFLGTKNKKDKSAVATTCITCLLGISEPGIYGYLLPQKKPLLFAIIAGSVGSIPLAVLGTAQYSFGAAGLLVLPNLINPNGIDNGFYGAIIGFVIAFALGTVLSYVWTKRIGQRDISMEDY